MTRDPKQTTTREVSDSRRKKSVATKGSSIYSKHLKPDAFKIRCTPLLGHERPMILRLNRDEVRLPFVIFFNPFGAFAMGSF